MGSDEPESRGVVGSLNSLVRINLAGLYWGLYDRERFVPHISGDNQCPTLLYLTEPEIPRPSG